MRSEKLIKNGVANLILQFVTIAFAFVSRKLFLDYLGLEYLSVNGLFTNILSLLSLSELGFSSAITYHLYKPLAQNDSDRISALMTFFKKIYRCVAGFVLVAGILLSFGLRFFVGDTAFTNEFLLIVYYLFLVQTVSSYFFSYRTAVVNANQEEYIFFKVNLFFKVFLTAVNLFNICVTRNFLVYLVCGIFINIICNMIKSRMVVKRFPNWIQKRKLAADERKQIYRDVKDLFIGQLSTKVLTSTDNIVISSFVGLNFVGLYENYAGLQNYILYFLNSAFSSLPAALSSIVVNETKEYSREILRKTTEVFFIIGFFCSISLFCLSGPFVALWYGEAYQLPQTIILALAVNLLLQCVKTPLWCAVRGTGLFARDKYISLVGVISNIVMSIMLVVRLGLVGVILGTIFSQLVQFVLKERLLYRSFYQMKLTEYSKIVFGGMAVYLLELFITWRLCESVESLNMNRVANLGICLLLCVVIPNSITWIFYHKTEGYRYVVSVVRRFLHRKQEKVV